MNPTTLDELKANIDALYAEFLASDENVVGSNCEAWFEAHGVDFSALPKFGGEEPEDLNLTGAAACWSWDETRALVGPGPWDLSITPRAA